MAHTFWPWGINEFSPCKQVKLLFKHVNNWWTEIGNGDWQTYVSAGVMRPVWSSSSSDSSFNWKNK